MHPEARPAHEALVELRDRINEALISEDEPDSAELAGELMVIHELALECRDAGTAWVKRGQSWNQIAKRCGVSIQTLQSRTKAWRRRKSLDG